jgi:hypothetical protein
MRWHAPKGPTMPLVPLVSVDYQRLRMTISPVKASSTNTNFRRGSTNLGILEGSFSQGTKNRPGSMGTPLGS